MKTVLIQINNSKAYKLLENLEDLDLIKVLNRTDDDAESLSKKYAGSISEALADDLTKYVEKSREEWS